MFIVFVLNHLNDPDAGILDNDKNKDGIPDFIIAINPIYLKVKLFEDEEELASYIQNQETDREHPGLCFGFAINEKASEEYELKMFFDDSVTMIGRTQNNIPY